MLQTRSYEMCPSSGNIIQWRKSLFDTILVYNNKNKPMLRYKFGSVYFYLVYFYLVRPFEKRKLLFFKKRTSCHKKKKKKKKKKNVFVGFDFTNTPIFLCRTYWKFRSLKKKLFEQFLGTISKIILVCELLGCSN